MGGSSGGGGSSSVTTTGGPVQFPDQFQPYIDNVGWLANQHLGEFNLSDFAGANPMEVPGLNEFQREAMGQIYNRGVNGIPTPKAESMLYENVLPWAQDVSRQGVGLQPSEYEALRVAGMLPDLFGGDAPSVSGQRMVAPTGLEVKSKEIASNEVAPTSDAENSAIDTLKMLSTGEYGDSPAFRAAEARIRQFVEPRVLNKMAAMGLGRSGAAGSQLQEQMTAEMMPLALQAMTQQETSAGRLGDIGDRQSKRYEDMYRRQLQAEELMNARDIAGGAQRTGLGAAEMAANAGITEAELRANAELQNAAQQRKLDAMLRGTLGTYMDIGQREASRESDTLNRMLDTAKGMYGPLLDIGAREDKRGSQSIEDLLGAGALDRDVAGQISTASYNDFLRRQALAELFHTGLIGQIPSFTSIPSTTTETTKTRGGK